MIPENYIFIDNTLDDAINNTENTSGTSAGNSIQNPTDVENTQDCATPLHESSAERAQLQNEINKFLASLMTDERKSVTDQEKKRLEYLMHILKGWVKRELRSGIVVVIYTVRSV